MRRQQRRLQRQLVACLRKEKARRGCPWGSSPQWARTSPLRVARVRARARAAQDSWGNQSRTARVRSVRRSSSSRLHRSSLPRNSHRRSNPPPARRARTGHLSRLRMGARTTTTQRRASAHGRSLSDVPPRGLADGALSLGSGLLLATGNGELTCVMPSDAAPGKRATFRAVYRHHSAFTASPDRLRTRPITTAILRRASEPDAALTEPHAPRGPAARPRPRRPCRTT
mmetsp:Transcript_26371/g.77444  ORF Transcript_26371/g.77444 Transcript_26371/m.77444 type:complete len:228 (-) Transcript_26371:95-778(-)